MKISIIGIGRLGGALAIALSKKNFQIENLIAGNLQTIEKVAAAVNPRPRILTGKDFSNIESDIIFIAVQDAKIESVAAKLSENLKTKPVVFHTSGALSSEILDELKRKGCAVGSIHPLVSVSDARIGADKFDGAFFCVEGDAPAIETGKKIVRALGGKSFTLSAENKILYHAAAVTASGHLVALVDAAIEILGSCGLSESIAQDILAPLIKSTVENLEAQTTAAALTGTLARADVATLEKHLAALEEKASVEVREIYLQMAMRSTNLAERQGASRANLEKIREKLLLAKTNLK